MLGGLLVMVVTRELPFSHLQRYNPQPPLSRFLEIFFLAGLQYDAEKPLTNRGGIVNFRGVISRDLPGISSSLGGPVLDLPLPPPGGGGSGVPDTICGLFLPVSPGFSMGADCSGPNCSGKVVVVQKVRFPKPAPVPAQAHSFPHVLPTSPTQSPGHGLIPLLWRGQGVVAARNFRLPSPFPPKRMHFRGGPPARGNAASPSPPASPLTPRTPPR